MSKKALYRTDQDKYESLKDFIVIDDVQKLDLRVAKVLAAEPVKSSNKILKAPKSITIPTSSSRQPGIVKKDKSLKKDGIGILERS